MQELLIRRAVQLQHSLIIITTRDAANNYFHNGKILKLDIWQLRL